MALGTTEGLEGVELAILAALRPTMDEVDQVVLTIVSP